MSYRFRILGPDEIFVFAPMTFPAYRPMLGNGSLALGAYSDGDPAGLALIAPSSDRTKAELLSLFVDSDLRRRGIGSMLLEYSGKILSRAGFYLMHTIWSETLPCAREFEATIARAGFSEPHKRLFTLRGEMDGDFGRELQEQYPKYAKPTCLPRKYALTFWRDMSEADRKFIRSREGLPNWYEPRANPFREESILEPVNSLVLRKDSEITGWLTVHRTAPDTFRYTDVFLREDLKRAGAVAIAMVTHAFWLQLAEGTPKVTMAVEKANEPLIRMYEKRMSCARLSWTWGAEKVLKK